MTVALTGATGFVGRHILQSLLDEGHKVRVLIRTPSKFSLEHKNIDIVEGDLSCLKSLKSLCREAQIVIHCAALTKSLKTEHMFEVNREGTKNLVKIAEAQKVNRFLMISSLAAREPHISNYAKSKYDGETALRVRKPDIGWDIIRPPAVYGPHDMQILEFFKLVKSRIGIIAGPKQASISLIHVEDLVDAVMMWVRSKISTQSIYEVCGALDEGYKWREILDVAARHMEVSPFFVKPPYMFLWLYALCATGSGLALNKPGLMSFDKLKEMRHTDWAVKDKSFEKTFNWSPKIDLETGFKRTIQWYYQQGFL